MGSSSSATVVTSRHLVSSSFNEDIVLPRRPEGGIFGCVTKGSTIYTFTQPFIGGICIYNKEDGGGGDGSASNASILFVCDPGMHQVVALDAISGTLIRVVYGGGLRSLWSNLLLRPGGICLLAPNTSGSGSNSDEPLLFIADNGNSRVQVVNSGTGSLVGSIRVSSPEGVAIGPSTSNTSAEPLLFVVCSGNHCVEVFNAKTLAYVRTIGCDQLQYPQGICIGDILSPSNTSNSTFSKEYSIFVADTLNHRISVFNPASGSFIRSIGSGIEGSGIRQLKLPTCVYYLPAGAGSSIPNGDPHIYVGEYSCNRLSVFNANSGAHVRHINAGYPTKALLPATTSDGDSFVYAGTTTGWLQIVHESNHARVIQLLFLLNHKIFDGFVINLDYELRDELVESLTIEMV